MVDAEFVEDLDTLFDGEEELPLTKNRGRAIARHHMNRLKAVRRKYSEVGDDSPVTTGKAYRTPRQCSCSLCGNPRRVERKTKYRLTRQELRDRFTVREETVEGFHGLCDYAV